MFDSIADTLRGKVRKSNFNLEDMLIADHVRNCFAQFVRDGKLDEEFVVSTLDIKRIGLADTDRSFDYEYEVRGLVKYGDIMLRYVLTLQGNAGDRPTGDYTSIALFFLGDRSNFGYFYPHDRRNHNSGKWFTRGYPVRFDVTHWRGLGEHGKSFAEVVNLHHP